MHNTIVYVKKMKFEEVKWLTQQRMKTKHRTGVKVLVEKGFCPDSGEHQQEEVAYSNIWNLVEKACKNFAILVLILNVHNFFLWYLVSLVNVSTKRQLFLVVCLFVELEASCLTKLSTRAFKKVHSLVSSSNNNYFTFSS